MQDIKPLGQASAKVVAKNWGKEEGKRADESFPLIAPAVPWEQGIEPQVVGIGGKALHRLNSVGFLGVRGEDGDAVPALDQPLEQHVIPTRRGVAEGDGGVDHHEDEVQGLHEASRARSFSTS